MIREPTRWRWRPGALMLSLLVGQVGCGGGGSGEPDGGPVADGSVDASTDRTGDAADAGPPGSLQVLRTTPADGESEVALDRTVRVVFDRDIDPATLDESTLLVTSGGEPVTGRLMSSRRVVQFIPTQFPAEAEILVRLGPELAGLDGRALGREHTFAFRTGRLTQGGEEPTDVTERPPFGDERFIGLARPAEYVLIGADYDDGGHNVVVVDAPPFDGLDPPPSREVLFASRETAMSADATQQVPRRAAVVAQLDDDPFEEVVVANAKRVDGGRLALLDRGPSGFTVRTLLPDLRVNPRDGARHDYRLAAGDVDHDGYDEIVVVGDAYFRAALWVLDDARRGHAVMAHMELIGEPAGSSESYRPISRVSVAVGRFDEDPADDILVSYAVLRGSTRWEQRARLVEDLSATWDEQPAPVSLGLLPENGPDPRVVAADVDGDGDDDAVLAIFYATGCRLDVTALLTEPGATPRRTETSSLVVTCGSGNRLALPWAPRVLDVEGDGASEVLVAGRVLRLGPDEDFVPMDLHVPWVDGDGVPVWLDVGDVDGNGMDDVFVLYENSRLQAWGYGLEERGGDEDGGTPRRELRWRLLDERGGGLPEGRVHQVVVAADVDRDGIVLEGVPADPEAPRPDPVRMEMEHRLVFSDDQVIGVIAAPPCFEGIGQNLNDCSTGLGTSRGGSITAGASVSVFAGASAGMEVEVSVGVFGSTTVARFAGRLATEVEARLYSSVTVGVTQTVVDYAGPGEDLVIFYTVPQHQFVYRVVSHPVPEMVGREMFVNIPISPRVLTVTRAYYNANNGEQPDIGDDVLPAITGDLSRYPSRSQMLELLSRHVPLGFTQPPVTVNEGSGYKELTLELSGEVLVGGELSIRSSVEAEACASAVCVGSWVGTTSSVFAEATLSASTIFTSSVGAIDSEHWPEHLFDYGLFAYLAELRDAEGRVVQRFPLVNYYVE